MENRKKCLISDTMGKLFIKQVAHELKNYNLYKTFASYFDVEGIADFAAYWNKRAGEELNHHNWVVDYLTEANYPVIYPTIDANDVEIKDYSTPFTASLDREIETTQMIYGLYELAQSEKDYMTMGWLQKTLLYEQIEEENTSKSALDIINQESDIFLKAERVLELLG